MSTGRLGLVLTSPRVAPGLLSHPAWAAVSAADVLLARSADEPLAEAMTEAGLAVLEVGDHAPAALARLLVDRAGDAVVVWLGSSDGDPGLSDALASEVSRLETPPEVELVVGSWDVQGGRLLDVVAAMDRLRSPGGCPWDAEQTHASLAPYLVEETHEVLEAIGSGDPRALAEELGDVLLQVVFHARVAEEAGEDGFDVDTVAGLLVEKLVRRHPHVFADGDATTPEQVEQEWERIKAAEKETAGEATRPTWGTASPRRCPSTSPRRRSGRGRDDAGWRSTPTTRPRWTRPWRTSPRPRSGPVPRCAGWRAARSAPDEVGPQEVVVRPGRVPGGRGARGERGRAAEDVVDLGRARVAGPQRHGTPDRVEDGSTKLPRDPAP